MMPGPHSLQKLALQNLHAWHDSRKWHQPSVTHSSWHIIFAADTHTEENTQSSEKIYWRKKYKWDRPWNHRAQITEAQWPALMRSAHLLSSHFSFSLSLPLFFFFIKQNKTNQLSPSFFLMLYLPSAHSNTLQLIVSAAKFILLRNGACSLLANEWGWKIFCFVAVCLPLYKSSNR